MTREEYVDHLEVFHPEHAGNEASPGESPRTLRRIGDARPPGSRNAPIGMARCPECGALIPKSRIDEHMEIKHTEHEEETLEPCPECEAMVRSDRLEKHIRKVHGNNQG
jgi:uncharacterized C2H2 Zn-finger protein